MKYRIWAVLPMLIVLTGCMLSPYRETAYYDLTPEAVSSSPNNSSFCISEFRNRSGAGNRFQYRAEDGRIISDPDNKWILQPGALISRALRAALAEQASNPKSATVRRHSRDTIRVSGELLFFETDLKARKFHLHAQLRIVRTGRQPETLDCNIMIPLQNTGTEAVVKAANAALSELAGQLNKVR